MKLPTLLQSLRPEEHKAFEKFLQSPFFQAGEQYLKYFRLLCKRHPSFELEKADLEAAYRDCFGRESLTDSKLYNLLSGLSKQIEQFLVVQQVLAPNGKAQGSLYDQLLVKALGIRNMGAYFRVEAQRLIDKTAARPMMEIDDYLSQQQLHLQVYYNHDTPKFGEPLHLRLAMEHLDHYYCMAKLRYVAEMKSRERILNVRYEMPLLDAVIAHSAEPGLTDTHPLWATYHHLVQLHLQGVDEAGFRGLMAEFTAKFYLLSKADQNVLLQHLINFGILLIAQDCAVEAELLSLYKLIIEAGLLLDGNRITYLSFINIANLASLCKEFEWVKAFIVRFSPYLEENKRQPSIDLAKAGLFYNQGMLDDAQRCLTPEIFPIPSFDILGRVLLIKIIFDRYIFYGKDYEFLITQLSSFEKYIQIKSWTAEKKDAQLNWIKYVRKLAKTKFEWVEVPVHKKESLQKKLRQLRPIVSKKWLEERITSL